MTPSIRLMACSLPYSHICRRGYSTTELTNCSTCCVHGNGLYVAGGARIGFYVCATIDLAEQKGAYMRSDACATRRNDSTMRLI
jgi:hypothetical protein